MPAAPILRAQRLVPQRPPIPKATVFSAGRRGVESDRRPRELGSAGDPISGLWAEVALDGIVLYDPGLTVARRLGEIRHRIAAGEIERREVNGEPYWVGVA